MCFVVTGQVRMCVVYRRELMVSENMGPVILIAVVTHETFNVLKTPWINRELCVDHRVLG